MNEHTNTLWLILMTPKKNILARISDLKTYGKIKIGEWKVMYGKKSMAGWVFRILGQPTSRTYSFHDGEVVFKSKQAYLPFRKLGIRFYIYVGMFGFFSLSVFTISNIPKEEKQIVAFAPVLKTVDIQEKTIPPDVVEKPIIRTVDPKFNTIFLEAKRSFQFGNIETASRIFQNYLDEFNASDRLEAANMISERYFLECSKWIAEHEERKAVLACEKSVKYSSHEKASAFLRSQDEKGKKLYLEGYTAVKFNPELAKEKFNLVLQAAKSKSTWRGKAQYQLRKLKLVTN